MKIHTNLIKLFILIVFLTIPYTFAYTEVQKSEDNITWIDSETTNDNEITISGLSTEQYWYFRSRNVWDNGTSDWVYTQTFLGGEKKMIGFIGILAAIAFIFLGLALYMENPVFYFFSSISFLIEGLLLIVTEVPLISNTFSDGIGVVLCVVAIFIAIVAFKVIE